MQRTESLMGETSLFLSLGKPMLFLASVVLCLGAILAFALHSVFIHNTKILGYTDWNVLLILISTSTLECFGHPFVRTEIRPPTSLTNLTFMSGWLPFLSLELLDFIPQTLTVLPKGEV